MSMPALLAEAVAAMPSPLAAPQSAALEAELREHYQVEHAVAVSSGTAALHAALIACGAGPGSEVLVPAVTVLATIAAIAATGARPVLVDAAADGQPFDLADAADKTTPRTRALVPVHLAGRTGNVADVLALAAGMGLPVIEDACQAQASRTTRGALAGTLGHLGCFSLKDGKIIASGEGGYTLTGDADLAAAVRAYRNHGLGPGAPHATRLGHNFRLAEPLAALARDSLAHAAAAEARRREQTELLMELVGQEAALRPIPPAPGEQPNGYAALWRIDLPHPRAFAEHLAECGVVNSVGTFGLRAASEHPALADLAPASCPRARAYVDTLLAVPVTSRDSDARLTAIGEQILKEASAWTV